ncbi:MAG: 16S rRNA (cytosine(1402)-N(4))-methyltransferase RsmH [bacterium]|nr:16S rRNA (cytosine(1402)-N(4))-methyltransferase RsmH [bacterium]MDZ4299860.1 16S rRNA (cytosine(1402)-N(4))-methyltransferase RsmH [Candidatus Sungbacteria bacterium]
MTGELMHTPVLLESVLTLLDPKPGEVMLDGTANGGGHTLALRGRVGSGGRVIAIERDSEVMEKFAERIKKEKMANVTVVAGNYADSWGILERCGIRRVDGILLDLGFSSWHVDEAGRGFSFQKNEPLDMRYDRQGGGETAADIINNRRQDELERMIRDYGEERFARGIAQAIVAARKHIRIMTTGMLVAAIRQGVPRRFQQGKIHPATRTFQALRIAVNDELGCLDRFLSEVSDLLAPGGRLAIISFHSLEDRLVKNFFKQKAWEGIFEIITRKPLTAECGEVRRNRRARSAKLRGGRFIRPTA